MEGVCPQYSKGKGKSKSKQQGSLSKGRGNSISQGKCKGMEPASEDAHLTVESVQLGTETACVVSLESQKSQDVTFPALAVSKDMTHKLFKLVSGVLSGAFPASDVNLAHALQAISMQENPMTCADLVFDVWWSLNLSTECELSFDLLCRALSLAINDGFVPEQGINVLKPLLVANKPMLASEALQPLLKALSIE